MVRRIRRLHQAEGLFYQATREQPSTIIDGRPNKSFREPRHRAVLFRPNRPQLYTRTPV